MIPRDIHQLIREYSAEVAEAFRELRATYPSVEIRPLNRTIPAGELCHPGALTRSMESDASSNCRMWWSTWTLVPTVASMDLTPGG